MKEQFSVHFSLDPVAHRFRNDGNSSHKKRHCEEKTESGRSDVSKVTTGTNDPSRRKLFTTKTYIPAQKTLSLLRKFYPCSENIIPAQKTLSLLRKLLPCSENFIPAQKTLSVLLTSNGSILTHSQKFVILQYYLPSFEQHSLASLTGFARLMINAKLYKIVPIKNFQ